MIGGVENEIEIGGPRADVGVRWMVMAFDAEGNLTGTSPKRSVELRPLRYVNQSVVVLETLQHF